MQEDTSKQTGVMAAIGMRAAMSERLMDPATYNVGFRDEGRSGGRRSPSPRRPRRAAAPRSPSYRRPSSSSLRRATPPRAARAGSPPRRKSAGRNVGRVKRTSVKKQSLKELRLARQEISALRKDLSMRSSTGASEQEVRRPFLPCLLRLVRLSPPYYPA